jgi:hypothetical protein
VPETELRLCVLVELKDKNGKTTLDEESSVRDVWDRPETRMAVPKNFQDLWFKSEESSPAVTTAVMSF